MKPDMAKSGIRLSGCCFHSGQTAEGRYERHPPPPTCGWFIPRPRWRSAATPGGPPPGQALRMMALGRYKTGGRCRGPSISLKWWIVVNATSVAGSRWMSRSGGGGRFLHSDDRLVQQPDGRSVANKCLTSAIVCATSSTLPFIASPQERLASVIRSDYPPRPLSQADRQPN
jgi:hypothetical protein